MNKVFKRKKLFNNTYVVNTTRYGVQDFVESNNKFSSTSRNLKYFRVISKKVRISESCNKNVTNLLYNNYPSTYTGLLALKNFEKFRLIMMRNSNKTILGSIFCLN